MKAATPASSSSSWATKPTEPPHTKGAASSSPACLTNGLDQPGSITIDFNQLYNPPCAYTPYATCPLPPQKNRLPVAIEAGEQRYAAAVKSE